MVNCRKSEEDEIFLDLHKFPLKKLEELDLSNCQHLTKIPSLNEVPKLRNLILDGYQDQLPLPVLKYIELLFFPKYIKDYLRSHVPLPIPEDCIELLFPKYIEDRIYGKKPFEIRIPHSTRIPNLCSHWTSGPCVEIQLSDSNSAWMGFALFVVFEILQKDDFDQSWELEETICNFYTHDGYENSLVFQNFINFRVGSSYMLCCYEPRGGQFGGLLDKASALLGASVTTKRPDLKVRGCAIHPISQQDAGKFVKNLTYETVQHLDYNTFDHHCKEILDETTTGDLMELNHDLQELGSTSTVNLDTCSKSKTQPRGELLKLYEGRHGREKCFHFCFPAPVISLPPWFLNVHAGDVTLCYITGDENLLDDQTWLGLELYVVFTRLTSASSEGDTNFFFHVDLCAHDHESLVMHGSLKIDSCLGTSDQLVVLHVPRVRFQQQLNQFQGIISALFRTINPEMEVLVCGSRLVFEQDLEDLIHSLTVVAGTLDLEGQQVDQRNAVEGEMTINCHSWFQRSTTAQVVSEQAPPSSITRLRKYRCYLQKKQGFVESDPTPILQSGSAILFHSKGGRFLEKRYSNQEFVAEEDTTSWLACDHHVRINIMAETLLYGSYSLKRWKRCLRLSHQYSKAATLSLRGHTISGLKIFNPSSAYNICFSGNWSSTCFDTHSRRMKLPPKLCDDDDWRGLVVFAVCQGDADRRLTTSSSWVKLVCHLKSNDYCLNPMPTCSVTTEKIFKQGRLPRLTWLTYIPRALLTEFNVVREVEVRIYINCPGWTVPTCDIILLYEQQEEKFQRVITDRWTSLFDDLPLIGQLVEDADKNVHKRRQTTLMLEPHIKDFDRDLIYNATLPCKKIPELFTIGALIQDTQDRCNTIEFQLPSSPSLCSDEDWIGLALCATFSHDLMKNYSFTCSLHTKKNGLCNNHKYETTNEEVQSLKRQDRRFIWLSYIPRRWFLHQLNDESVLFATFRGGDWPPRTAGHRFVYEHNVEEFKQLCIDLHQLCD
ncbi:hypothetical protein M0R45_004552 [Rubus argutus]|uniref:Uncharacterized protein n=1 Tax=Rubus argutus TaxID=59490 RepID=A0AAW1YK71_RUBAR